MTQLEQIKSEIERRITDNTFGAKLELIDLLSFIESLEKDTKESDVSLDTAQYFYDLGRRHSDNAPKIKGWVARCKSGELSLYHSKPERDGNSWDGLYFMCRIDRNNFPDLKWEDEPIEVELEIHRV